MELLKGLLKWIIVAIIFIAIIALIVKFASKETKTKKHEPSVNIVENGNQESQDSSVQDPSLEPIQQSQSVDSPDTASSGAIEMLVGLTIIGAGLTYVYKNRNVKVNSN